MTESFQRLFRVRPPRDRTAAQWAADNPLLSNGEPGIESDTGLFKFGDGVSLWNDLPYANSTDFINASYITLDDETADLPNSWQLVAGSGIALTQSSPAGTLEISALAPASSPADPDASYVTALDETDILPNSRQLIAGPGIVILDGSPPGTIEISAPTLTSPPADPDASFITALDETATLPNSRQIVAGPGIDILDSSPPGTIQISANGSVASTTVLEDTYANIPAAAAEGRLFLPTDGIALYRDSGSVWTPYGPIFPCVTPDDSAFSWRNQGSAVVTAGKGMINLRCPGATRNLHGREITISTSGAKTFVVGILQNMWRGNYQNYGIYVADNGTGKIVSFGYLTNGSSLTIFTNRWDSASTYNATIYSNIAAVVPLMWFKYEDDGSTARRFYISADKQYWELIDERPRHEFVTEDRIGFFVDQTSGNPTLQISVVSWEQTV